MKDFLSDLGKLLFTGIGLVQTIVTVILIIVVAGYYNFSYKNITNTQKVLAETVQCCSGTPECGTGRQCVTGSDPNCTAQGKGVCEDMPGPAQGCCKTKNDCAPWEECRISNAACGPGGLSCGIKQDQCKANGNSCSGSWECCSGKCNDITKICEGGAPFTPRSSDQVCTDEKGSITTTCIADANCKANGGTCCNKGSANYCCYGDSSSRKDGSCYAGGQQTSVTCNGNTITNNTDKTIKIKVFKGQGEDLQCPISSPGGSDRDLGPGASMSAHCEQLDAPGYCGVCDDSACTPPAATPTPPSRPTPTSRPSPSPTPTSSPTATPTPRPSSTPTPTPTTPSLPSCGDLCLSNWNGSPQGNGECPQDAPTCWAFSQTEWRCVVNPDWDDFGCSEPNPTDTPTPTATPTPEEELTPTPTKPTVLGAKAPTIVPKSGIPTELTSGLIKIGLVGILLRFALLLI